MGVVSNEPSMEDILSSIKRIIADGSDRAASPRVPRRRAAREEAELAAEDEIAEGAEDQDPTILELTEMVEEEEQSVEPAAAIEPEIAAQPAPAQPVRRKAAAAAEPAPAPVQAQSAVAPDAIISDVSAEAARQSLSQLSSLLVRPQEGESNTLEGLVREMLRPMLKDWLEAKLPEMVETMVKKEIDRIVGRLG